MRKTLLLLLGAVLALQAQTGTDGSILGIVRDQSGAVIAGASVRVTSLETGAVRAGASNQSGNFEVLAVPRGFYSVTVSSPGMVTWELARIELTAAEMKRVSPVLRVGDVKEQVTVEAGIELMQTEKASVEANIELKQVRWLPLNGRNPLELVNLVPGMRFLGVSGNSREHTVQGLGQREDQTGFSVDGLDANDPSNERGIALPTLEAVAQFNVQTSNFSAENGRNPLQVIMVTKSGANQLHGTLFAFHRNSALDARNAFAGSPPKLVRNQFGASAGGPVIRDKTFFFASYAGGRIRGQRIYNSVTVAQEMLNGEFGTRRITDPLTGAQFQGNRIPLDRMSSASRFFFPHLVLPNAPGNRFRALASQPTNTDDSLLRVDHQIRSDQRLWVRWIRGQQKDEDRGYRPDVVSNQNLVQHNLGLNYNRSLTPATLFTLAMGYLQSDSVITSPLVGKENLTALAGIRGVPTAGREEAIGLPSVGFTGYAGFSWPAQVPARFRREDLHGKAGLQLVRGSHSLSFGYEYNDRRTLAHHASSFPRGDFTFNSQYTGDGFADYLLGLLASDQKNFPLKAFGMGHSPYSAAWAQDYWRLHPNFTLNLGMRLDWWHAKTPVRNTAATFDVRLGKAIADVDENGRVDLTAQPVSPFLAEFTRGLWIPAPEAGIPRGLFQASGYVSPRLGAAWRPTGKDDLVLRGGYGIYTSSYNGNITGSQVIGPPYWTFERQAFTRASLQRWETAFPADPTEFAPPSVAAARYDVRPMKMHEFNVSLQKSLPWIGSAATISYVGNRGRDLITRLDHNEAPPGQYVNLQAAKPYPRLGTVRIYENIGRSWYNSLQAKVERRFTRGLGYTFAYAFARNIDEFGSAIMADFPTPFAPRGYDRGRSELERRQVMTTSAIYEIPVGRGRAFGADWRPLPNFLLGGWQLSGIYSFTSGSPLSFTVPGNTLGNGFNTRPNLVGDPRLAEPAASQWFNPAAFANPARFAFGNSGLGLIDGPGRHVLDLGLIKDFHFSEARYVQFRWELFNAPNHVNLANPNTTLGQISTAQINSAGAARQMQFGMKVIF